MTGWELDGRPIGETLEEVREYDTLELVLRYSSESTERTVQELINASEQVEVQERPSGGFVGVDMAGGENTFENLKPPSGREQVRSVDTWLLSSYEKSVAGPSGDSYDLELELIPKTQKSFDNEYGTLPDNLPDTNEDGKFTLDFERGTINTRNVTVNVSESNEGSENLYELETVLTPMEVRIMEENASYLNLSTLREVPDEQDIVSDRSEDDRNTVNITPPNKEEKPLVRGQYVFMSWETEYRNGAFFVTMEVALEKPNPYLDPIGLDADSSEYDFPFVVDIDAADKDRDQEADIPLLSVIQGFSADGTDGYETVEAIVSTASEAVIAIKGACGGTYHDDGNARSNTTVFWEYDVDLSNVDKITLKAAQAGENAAQKSFGDSISLEQGGQGGNGVFNGGQGGPIDWGDAGLGEEGAYGSGGGGASAIDFELSDGTVVENVFLVSGRGGSGGTVSGGGGGGPGGSGGAATTDDTLSGAGGAQEDGDAGESAADTSLNVGGAGGKFAQDPPNDPDNAGSLPDVATKSEFDSIASLLENSIINVDTFAVGDSSKPDEVSRPEGGKVVVQVTTPGRDDTGQIN